MPYDPPRLDKSLVDLSGYTEHLIEALARHNHDVWGRQKLDDGHVYGPKVDPEKKTHNCLVDYSELPEQQKVYDRLMAIETWKQLIIHGFRVAPPQDGWRSRDDAADLRAAELKHILEGGGAISHARLLKEWKDQEADPRLWARYPALYSLVAQRLLNVGEADNCYDVARAGLKILPGNPALIRWQAMALVELSATRKALELMSELRKRHDEPETRGFLAYAALRHADELLHRRIARGDDPKVPTPEEQRLLELSLEEYRGAKSDRPAFAAMFAVGAAIVASRLDHPDARDAISHAHAILTRAERQPESALDPFWQHTFVGEIALLESRVDDAIAAFREAGNHADRRFGLVNTSFRMARALSAGFSEDLRTEIEGCFPTPHGRRLRRAYVRPTRPVPSSFSRRMGHRGQEQDSRATARLGGCDWLRVGRRRFGPPVPRGGQRCRRRQLRRAPLSPRTVFRRQRRPAGFGHGDDAGGVPRGP